jgi:transposase
MNSSMGFVQGLSRTVPCADHNLGDIIIADNLGNHKVKPARNAIRSVDAKLLFFPPYIPDSNSIQMRFSKIKTLL